MQINSLPIRRPDETLYSVVARTRLMNAAKDDRDACRSLFGHSRNTRVSDFPVNLMHFCAVTQGVFGTPCSILDDMTLAGFFSRIDSHPWHAGNSHPPVATAGYGLSVLSNGRSNIWHACPLCLRSEMARDATGYWHLSHHLPAAFFCATHDEPLSVCLSSIQTRHNHFVLPQNTVLVNSLYRRYFTENHDTLMRLTKLGMDILRDSEKPIDPRVAHAAIFNALDEHGLLTKAGLIRSEQFFVEFFRRYSSLQEISGFCGALSRPGIEILHRKLRHGYMKRSATHNLLLMDWLFGTWASFKEQCTWQETMGDRYASTEIREYSYGARILHAPLRSVSEIDGVEQVKHRKICLIFLDANTPATRSKFARAAPKSFRWLLRYDFDWVNKYLPATRCSRKQGELF